MDDPISQTLRNRSNARWKPLSGGGTHATIRPGKSPVPHGGAVLGKFSCATKLHISSRLVPSARDTNNPAFHSWQWIIDALYDRLMCHQLICTPSAPHHSTPFPLPFSIRCSTARGNEWLRRSITTTVQTGSCYFVGFRRWSVPGFWNLSVVHLGSWWIVCTLLSCIWSRGTGLQISLACISPFGEGPYPALPLRRSACQSTGHLKKEEVLKRPA